ncbi:MAG: RpiB/LacA/LacB family sugar-phosphate isomerase [Patescibacteria group bacterium]
MIYLGADHAGFKLKEEIKKYLKNSGFKYQDLGNQILNSEDDYPDFAYQVAKKVAQEKNSKGILFCGTGQGMALAANKVEGIYAMPAWNKLTAKHAADHNQANILTLGGHITSIKSAKEIIKIWLKTKPLQKMKYSRRINKVKKIENEQRN